MVLNDNIIRLFCEDAETPMISPFVGRQVREIWPELTGEIARSSNPAISFGLSSYGYDIRLANGGLKVFKTGQEFLGHIIDPKAFDDFATVSHQLAHHDDTGTFYVLPPRAYALGLSVETFEIPDNVLGICYCKSTYARCGLMINTTPLEPGWRGRLVIEFSNDTDLPMKIYVNEGVAQVVFFTGDVPSITYADRAGKYQDQQGIVTARI